MNHPDIITHHLTAVYPTEPEIGILRSPKKEYWNPTLGFGVWVRNICPST